MRGARPTVHAIAIVATLVANLFLVLNALYVFESNLAEAVAGLVMAPVLSTLGILSLTRPRGNGTLLFIAVAVPWALLLGLSGPGVWPWVLPYLIASLTALLYRFSPQSAAAANETSGDSTSGDPR